MRAVLTEFLLATTAASGLTACDGGTSLHGDGGPAETSPPPVPDIASGGWRDSGTPWTPPGSVDSCASLNWTLFDILPTVDSLYAAWGWTVFDPSPGPSDVLYCSVLRNTGSGWMEYLRSDCSLEGGVGSGCESCVERLVGSSSGGSVVRTWGGSHPPLGLLDADGVHLWPEDVWQLSDPFVVTDHLAYAVLGGTDSKVVRFDGSAWTPLPEILPADLPYQLVWQVWADENDIWVAGDRGTVLSLGDAGWQVHVLPTLEPITALWGSDGNDVWVGDKGGELFHWDGGTWETVSWPNLALERGDPCGEPSYVLGIWGSEGVLYVHTGRQLTRRSSAGDFAVLGYWPGTAGGSGGCVSGLRIIRMRGTSAVELFLAAVEPGPEDAVLEPADDGESCVSRPFVLFWDGSVFHWI